MFCDRGTPSEDPRQFTIYQAVKDELVERGMPETPWFRWRLGLWDFDQGLVGPVRSVERGFELGGRYVSSLMRSRCTT